MVLEAEIRREIQRGFADGVKSSERLERLINRRTQLVREMELASSRTRLRQNFTGAGRVAE